MALCYVYLLGPHRDFILHMEWVEERQQEEEQAAGVSSNREVCPL